ncbi:MAG: DUF4422 domain-containing protein, partial [Acetatifactor sp.]|nr:DUF4422 domain-containing protein [Acetatifactor sp.]
MQYQGDYLKEIRADIRYGDIRTEYVFAPLKVWGVEKVNSRKGSDYVCEDGTLCWNGRKGYGTEYELHYFGMNAGQPQFDLFLEEAGRAETENPEVNREVWETVMAECEKRVGRVFSPKDLDDCKKEIYDSNFEWLFSLFEKAEAQIDASGYDDYHKRVYGFISEFLLYVWTQVQGLRVYECKVGMTDEKRETTETKERLAAYFAKKDISGAKSYILACLEKRPDVLMEASDITGELKLSMQVIA